MTGGQGEGCDTRRRCRRSFFESWATVPVADVSQPLLAGFPQLSVLSHQSVGTDAGAPGPDVGASLKGLSFRHGSGVVREVR